MSSEPSELLHGSIVSFQPSKISHGNVVSTLRHPNPASCCTATLCHPTQLAVARQRCVIQPSKISHGNVVSKFRHPKPAICCKATLSRRCVISTQQAVARQRCHDVVSSYTLHAVACQRLYVVSSHTQQGVARRRCLDVVSSQPGKLLHGNVVSTLHTSNCRDWRSAALSRHWSLHFTCSSTFLLQFIDGGGCPPPQNQNQTSSLRVYGCIKSFNFCRLIIFMKRQLFYK